MDDIMSIGVQDTGGTVEPYYRPSIERLRIVLMFFLCINLFGFPSDFGGYVQVISHFVPPAFFLLSGYLVFRKGTTQTARIVRTIKRTAIAFGITVGIYAAVNIIIGFILNGNAAFLEPLKAKKLWFNFLVLNVWPFKIGSIIWYLQALLYAYIILYFLDKWKLLKYDWIIMIVLFVITAFTGEFAGILKIFISPKLPTYICGNQPINYIPGNFLTRALPYILLGKVLRRMMKRLREVKLMWLLLAAFIGICLMFGEAMLLNYFGCTGYYAHLLGMIVTCVAVCIIAFRNNNIDEGIESFFGFKRRHINLIYYICEPIGLCLEIAIISLQNLLPADAIQTFLGWVGIVTFAICFCIAWAYAYIEKKIKSKKQV